MPSSQSTVTFAAVVLIAAASLACPWAEITATTATLLNDTFGGAFGDAAGGFPLGGSRMTVTMNGFNGTITPVGIEMPAWLLGVATIAGGALALAQIHAKVDVPALVYLLVFGLPSLVLLLGIVGMLAADNASLGIGMPLLLLANGIGLASGLKLAANAGRDERDAPAAA